MHIEQFRPLDKPLLLNCLDYLYGHSLLKLLNAQYYVDKQPTLDLVLLIPKFLRWMVPDGVAAVWTVDQSLRNGWTWNDSLGEQIHRQVEHLQSCRLALALSHPRPTEFDIERFTRIEPFNLTVEDWTAQTRSAPTVTFVWREDRCWLQNRGILRKAVHPGRNQEKVVTAFANELRTTFPNLNFAVAGIGASGRLPDWIEDHRHLTVDPDTEKKWCRLYARSQIVVGMHGSNMLLPSALAGCVIELLPGDRLGNIVQDLLPRTGDPREALVRYQFVSADATYKAVARSVISMLRQLPLILVHFNKPWCDHTQAVTDSDQIAKLWRQIA